MNDERGSMAVELAILTPPLIVLLLFVAALGRISQARNSVDEAARDAAREASIARFSGEAQQRATRRAMDDLAADGISCRAPDIAIDTTNLRPGGRVTATVVCTVGLGDLLLLRVPGARTITSTAVEVVDVHRGSS
jgi:Flp pilus assembly protein TadG